jgi:hypothetical protein
MLNKLSIKVVGASRGFIQKAKNILKEEKGEATILSTLGIAAIVVTVLIIIHGAITGWLPNFIDGIFNKMDQL